MGGRPETRPPKKVKGKDRIAFEPGKKPGTDLEVVFARIITPPRKKKDKAHATYVSMSVKLPAFKKPINILQQKLAELVEMLLQVDDTIDTPPLQRQLVITTHHDRHTSA